MGGLKNIRLPERTFNVPFEKTHFMHGFKYKKNNNFEGMLKHRSVLRCVKRTVFQKACTSYVKNEQVRSRPLVIRPRDLNRHFYTKNYYFGLCYNVGILYFTKQSFTIVISVKIEEPLSFHYVLLDSHSLIN